MCIRDSFDTARKLGHNNINMDLIAGLPLDTVEGFSRSLAGVMDLGPVSYTHLYRLLAACPQGMAEDDLRPLFAKLGPGSAGKTLISLKALEQLALAERRGGRWRLLPATGKKDLFSAPVLQKLEE